MRKVQIMTNILTMTVVAMAELVVTLSLYSEFQKRARNLSTWDTDISAYPEILADVSTKFTKTQYGAQPSKLDSKFPRRNVENQTVMSVRILNS